MYGLNSFFENALFMYGCVTDILVCTCTKICFYCTISLSSILALELLFFK